MKAFVKIDQFAPLYPDEFESPDIPGSGDMMDYRFMQKLYEARKIADIPFIINSGWRSKEHNAKVGGKKDSSHRIGRAADIACGNSRHRGIILAALRMAGFNRIGIANTFIHVDDDPDKDAHVTWLY